MAKVWVRQGLAQTLVHSFLIPLPNKKFPLCQNLALFPKLLYHSGLIFFVLMCWEETAKKSYKPLMRILDRGSFSFIDLIEKRIRLVSPPSYFISIVFLTVNLDPDLA